METAGRCGGRAGRGGGARVRLPVQHMVRAWGCCRAMDGEQHGQPACSPDGSSVSLHEENLGLLLAHWAAHDCGDVTRDGLTRLPGSRLRLSGGVGQWQGTPPLLAPRLFGDRSLIPDQDWNCVSSDLSSWFLQRCSQQAAGCRACRLPRHVNDEIA